MDYLDGELIVEVLDLIVCLGEVLHRISHQLLLLLLAGVRLLGQLKDKHQYKLMLAPVFRIRISVADPSCLSRIPDPNFYHHGSEFIPSWIRIFSIPDPHQREQFKYFKPQKCF